MEPYMRDTRKLRDKIEVAIDPRQIALLVIGEALLLILVFILGFGVGRAQRAKPRVEVAQQHDQIESQMVIEQSVEEAYPASPEDTTPPQEAKPEPPQEGKEFPDEQPVYTVDLSNQGEAQPPEIAMPEPEEPAPANEQNLIIELPPDEQGGSEQTHSGEQGAPVPSPPESPAPPPEDVYPPPSGRYYTVQVSAFETAELAQQYIKRLEEKYRLTAYMTEGQVRGQTWYRVRIGRFQDFEKAKEFAGALEQKLGVKPFIDLVSE